MKRRIICVFVVIVLLLFSTSACAKQEAGASASETQPISQEAEVVPDSDYDGEGLPGYFSQQQKTELTTLYNEAYEDEKNGIDGYINDYILLVTGQTDENYDPYAEMLEGLVGTTESLYQAVNDFDPGIKNELAILTEQKYGYLAGKGMQYLLSDSELGQTLRQAGEVAVLALTDIMLNWADSSGPSVTTFALAPRAVNGDYALMRTRGSLAGMVSEATQPYMLAQKAIDERYEALEATVLETATEDLDMRMNADPDNPEEVEAVYERMKISQPIYARLEVLKAKREALTEDEKQVIDDFLSAKGIIGYSLDPEAENYYPNLPVMQQYIYYIMDSNNQIYWSFTAEGELHATMGENGDCAIWHSDFSPEDADHVIVDKNGKVLFQNEIVEDDSWELKAGSVVYYNVSPCGNVLRQTYQSDFDHGDYSTVELVTPEGKTIPVLDNLDYFAIEGIEEFFGTGLIEFKGGVSAYGDEICVKYQQAGEEKKVVIDMKTGELRPEDDVKEHLAEEYASMQKSYGFHFTLVGDNYVLNWEDGMLYDRSGNKIADFSAGEGPQEGYPKYDNGNYWVVTNTNYMYVTNEKFERMLEPIKLCEDAETKYYPGYGLCVFDPQEYTMKLYNEKGETILEMYKDSAAESWGQDSDGWPEVANGFICGNAYSGWYNMKQDTENIMMIPDYSGEIADMGVNPEEE